MPSLAGTKRPAETPDASPTEVTALTKRSRTHYDYYEEEDSEAQEQEEQWIGDDWSDDSSVMDLDDADEVEDELLSPDDLGDEDFDEKSGNYWREQDTKADRDAPPSSDGFSHRQCDDREKFNYENCIGCGCSQQGHACQIEICGCRGQPTYGCDNRFNHLDTNAIFGPGKVVLHPCFISWMIRQKDLEPGKITTEFLFDMAYDVSGPIPFEKSGACADWVTKWNKLDPVEKERGPGEALQQQLNRLAFTCVPSNDMFYSLCREDNFLGPWQSTEYTRHCHICGKCAEADDFQSPKCHES